MRSERVINAVTKIKRPIYTVGVFDVPFMISKLTVYPKLIPAGLRVASSSCVPICTVAVTLDCGTVLGKIPCVCSRLRYCTVGPFSVATER